MPKCPTCGKEVYFGKLILYEIQTVGAYREFMNAFNKLQIGHENDHIDTRFISQFFRDLFLTL